MLLSAVQLETMFNSVENFTFKPILIILKFLFINTNISSQCIQRYNLTKWHLRCLKIFTSLIKIAIISYAWITLFYNRQVIYSNIIERGLQNLQTTTWTLMITTIYGTSSRTSSAIPKLIKLIRLNTKLLNNSLFSPFLIISLVYFIAYAILTYGEIMLYVLAPQPYYTLIHYNVFIFCYLLDIFYTAMICMFESLIRQQYNYCNQTEFDGEIKLRVIESLSEQCCLLNQSFGGYMLWKLTYTYLSAITASYIRYFDDGPTGQHPKWRWFPPISYTDY